MFQLYVPCYSPNNILITMDVNTYKTDKITNILGGATLSDAAMFTVGKVSDISKNIFKNISNFFHFQDLYMIGSVWLNGKEIAVKFEAEKTWSLMGYKLPHTNPWYPTGTLVPSNFDVDC